MKYTAFCLGSALALLSSCYRVSDKIEPKIDCYVQDNYLLSLPSPFPPLTLDEKEQDWGKEYQIALRFAHEMDLYQAITAFKRAFFLVPVSNRERKLELEYEIVLCYYFGKKYNDAIYSYEHSQLRFVNTDFPALQDLLLVLFDSYTQLKDTNNADRFFQYIEAYYPETAKKLRVSEALEKGDIATLAALPEEPNYEQIHRLVDHYTSAKKSVTKAQLLNTFIPGMGYLYIGQKQTSITAFLVNGLFIGASYYFFHNGNIPAGAIFTAFEAGWYFGGIYGVGEEAKFYNERLYETYATPVMNQTKMFPAFMIRHAF